MVAYWGATWGTDWGTFEYPSAINAEAAAMFAPFGFTFFGW